MHKNDVTHKVTANDNSKFETGRVDSVAGELAHQVEQGQLLLARERGFQLVQCCQVKNRSFLRKNNLFNFLSRFKWCRF